MSTPLARSPRSQAGSAPAPTRQQLDELDALLQRMLDLPVNPSEDVPDVDSPPPEPPRQRAVDSPPPEPPRQRAFARPEAGLRIDLARPEDGLGPTAPPRGEAQPAEPPAPPRRPQPRQEPAVSGSGRVYPASYMVVETRTPSNLSGQGPAAVDAVLGPRILPGTETPAEEDPFEPPVPGGRHDLVADEPEDPVDEQEGIGPHGVEDGVGTAEDWVPFQSSWQPSEQTWKPLAQTWEQARAAPAPAPTPPGPTPSRQSAAREAPGLRPTMPPGAPRESSAEAAHRSFAAPAGPIVVTQTASPEAPALPQSFVRPAARPAADAVPDALTRPMRTPAPEPYREPARAPFLLLPLVWFNVVFDALLTLGGPAGSGFKGRGGRNFLAVLGVLCLLGAVALAVADGIGWTW